MLMSADFHYLIFANYQVDRKLLEPRVPDGTQLQLLNGKSYVSLVAFLFKNLTVEGIAAPFHQEFEQVNLRFYVKKQGQNDEKYGVVFIKELVPKTLLAAAARELFNEKYISLPMDHRYEIAENQFHTAEYRWTTDKQECLIRTVFEPRWEDPAESSPEYFLTKRPYGYTPLPAGGTREITMEHRVWRTTPAVDTTIDLDIPDIFGSEFVPYLTLKPASVFIADGSPVKMTM